MPFVVDASATLPWCFPDEATPSTEALLDRVAAGEQAIVPAHWLTEVSNALLMAIRRRRIDLIRAERFLDKLAALKIAIEPPVSMSQAQTTLALSIKHNLTFYDAGYLDLVIRTALPLATLDGALIKAARAEGISIVT